jgi:hypothetical protein
VISSAALLSESGDELPGVMFQPIWGKRAATASL